MCLHTPCVAGLVADCCRATAWQPCQTGSVQPQVQAVLVIAQRGHIPSVGAAAASMLAPTVASYTRLTDQVSAAAAADLSQPAHPMNILKQIAQPGDFVVFKLVRTSGCNAVVLECA